MRREDQSFLYRHRLPFKAFGIVILASLFLTGAYFLSKLGPQQVDPYASFGDYDEQKGRELLKLSEQKETEFRSRAEQRAPTEEDYALLDEAMAAVEQYNVVHHGYDDASSRRLADLKRLRDQYRGEALYEESTRLEVESAALMEKGEGEQGLTLLRRALALQKKINEDYPYAERADSRRLTYLTRDVQKLEARPLYEASVQAQTEAEEAISANNFGRARLLLQKAIDLQKKINLEYRALQYADIQRLSKLEVMLSSLESGDLYEQIEAYASTGKEAESAGRYAEAAEAYQNAFRLQKQLNQDFPQSRFAEGRRLDELRDMRENAFSRDMGDGINVELEQLDGLLRDRKVWQGIELLRSLYPKVQQFSEQFPRSTVLPDKALLKLQYLSAIEDDLGFLQDRLYGQLLPVEGQGDWQMLRTEVSQALYMSVMLNSNPSRNKGERLPVDSGNWEDAKAFAERVSWIMGRPARLPSEDEYYAALGSLRYVKLDEVSWNQENSGGETHDIATREPNAQGFHDLLGNVAEWLQSDSIPGEGEAILAGGSAKTSVDQLVDKPMEIVNARMRNRFAGFRVVVEVAL